MRLRAEGAECPAWSLEGPEGVVPGSVQWSAQLAHVAPTWKRLHGGQGRVAPVVGLPVRVADAPAAQIADPAPRHGLRQFRNHVLVEGGGQHVCLACGRYSRDRRRLERAPCPGNGVLRNVHRAALNEGVFDASILRLGARAVALAAGMGRAVPPPPPPAPD